MSTDEIIEMQVAEHLHCIMDILGIERTEGNKETPKRIAKMWNREVFFNRKDADIKELRNHLKKFPSENYLGRMIICKDIPFSSMCEHHWMPFIGTVTVGYVPYREIIGLSKIPRIVKWYSKRPQLQERFTTDIAEELFNYINPLAVFVEVKAKHTCVTSRGIELPCETVTFEEVYACSEEDAKNYLEEFRAQNK